MLVDRRSLPEHMADGPGDFSPARIDVQIRPVEITRVTKNVLLGNIAPRHEADRSQIVDAMLAAILAGPTRPKVAICVPSTSNRNGSALVREVVRKSTAAGLRVLDMTGSGEAQQRAIENAMRQEERLIEKSGYAGSQFDVVVGIERPKLGFNWAACSDVFMVGFSGSTVDVLQALGRATRKKSHASFPASLAERAAITFFVPVSASDDLRTLDRRHAPPGVLGLRGPS